MIKEISHTIYLNKNNNFFSKINNKIIKRYYEEKSRREKS